MYIIKDKKAKGLWWTGTKFGHTGITTPKVWADVLAAMACAYGGTAKGAGKAKTYAEANPQHEPVVVRIDLVELMECPPLSECTAACENAGFTGGFIEPKGDYG